VLERFNIKAPVKLLKKISIPVVIAGVLFSTLHQSSFGSLYLIVPGRLHPLWYSSLLPVHFYISCIGAGLSMIIFESYLIARAFNKGLKMNILSGAAFAVLIDLIAGFGLKVFDFISSGKLGLLSIPCKETYLFYLEILLGTFIPVFLLSQKKVREDRKWLYISTIFVFSGFILNRFNVSITGLERSAGYTYFPSFDEISITVMLVVLAMFAFRLVVKNFPVFEEEESFIQVKQKNVLETKQIILSE
jgi:Ni/Fe-hydrogenase subunit HybB-like protein